MSFIDKDFLLKNETAKKLFNDYAKEEPIFDFHCHLSPKEIYENKNFEDITQAWLGGDRVKRLQVLRNLKCGQEQFSTL